MNQALLTEEDLRDWTGYQRRGDIERVLRERAIPIIYGRDGQICTTLEAINRTLLGSQLPSGAATPRSVF
jgi:glutamate 5-kinase